MHDNVMLQRFQLESKAVSMLKHPNIIGVHDFGLSPQGVPYLIMDFLEGKTVSDVVAEKEFLEPERCVDLFTQICSALAHTHNKGVIHRDIKPSNLIVSIGDDGKEFAQVVDFGIAKLLEREASGQSKLTASGEVFGSPAYMSPEQCNGSPIDARTDIYALGCVIYNCLTGRPPLLGRNAMETVLMHIRDMPKPFGEIRPDLSISPKLERVVFRSLEKDPEERYATMTEFGAELAESIKEGNNNTTWIIPAQKAAQDGALAPDIEHTMPVNLAPQTVPTTEANNPHQTHSMRPDALKPSADLGHADPVVSLNDNAGPDSRADGRGRMNPNAMIMPGSDLFGYESIAPAAPDSQVGGSASHAPSNQSQNSAPMQSTPARSAFVEDVPLNAPVRHTPLSRPTQASTPVSNNNAVNSGFSNPPAIQNQSSQQMLSRQNSQSPQENVSTNDDSKKAKDTKLLLIVGGVSVLVVIILLLIAWKMQSS